MIRSHEYGCCERLQTQQGLKAVLSSCACLVCVILQNCEQIHTHLHAEGVEAADVMKDWLA